MVSRTPGSSSASAAVRTKARVLIIEAPYYEQVAEELAAGAIAELEAAGASYDRIIVPGAFEIPQALAQAVAADLVPDTYSGVIVLGCVIRGETSHYDVVVGQCNHWLYQLAIEHRIPLGNAVLTVDTEAQAMARASGGRDGKGGDAARACLSLIALAKALSEKGA